MPLTTIYDGGTRVVGSTSQPLFPQPIHPDVAGYVSRLVANGYSPSTLEIDAVNNLVYKFVANGFYDKFQVIYPVIGNSGTTSTLDLKNLCNGVAFGSWTFDSLGMKPNSVSNANYINTNYNPFVRASQNDAHLCAYVRQSQFAIRKVMGTHESGNGTNFFQINASTGSSGNIVVFAAGAGFPTGVGIADSRGLWFGNRSASNAQQLYFNGRLSSTGTGASVALTNFNRNVYLGAVNAGGNASFASDQGITFSSIGFSLTAKEASDMYRAVQAYQTTLGRQV
jgi:hypothetical protein